MSSYSLEEVAAEGAVTWFQLYMLRDRSASFDLIHRAEDAGCEALMVTVDVPRMGRRLRDVRNHFTLPADVTAANFASGVESAAHRTGGRAMSAVAMHTSQLFEPAFSWSDLAEVRRRTDLPLIVKGLLDPADAVHAVKLGADAVVVSNHGGRQFDGAIASIDALDQVRTAVAGHSEVYMDSGIRGGIDILRALALGADGVLIGRPLLWGLAVAGAEGAAKVLSLLADELRDALGLTGCPDLESARRLRTSSRRSYVQGLHERTVSR